MGSLDPGTFDVKKIAIVGAGPCGLAAAKYLLAQDAFESVTIFEQQDEIGGVWNYSSETPERHSVPQDDPFLTPDRPVARQDGRAPVFPSPMYEKLHANIPGNLMRFSDKQFPKGSWAFPRRETIQEYLLEYSEELRHLIKFTHRVDDITNRPKNGRDKWALKAHDTVTNEAFEDTFDAIVIANGHYATPAIPIIKNVKAFAQAHPSIISHSKVFRTPTEYRDKKVIVVGNGPSGIDIALQINQVCKQPALLSVRTATPADRLEHTGCREVPEITEFLPDKRGVVFSDGTHETDIDAIVFCTGFFYSYPFLPDLQHRLITSGKSVHGLYKHFLCIDHPTLVFPGLNIKAIPWPLSEAQAAIFSAVWSNNLDLPDVDEMKRWSKDLEERKGDALHVFSPLEDGHYINEMHDWVIKSRYLGKQPSRWDDQAFWEREIYANAKLRFEKDGCKATTLGELGLHYHPEKSI